jgi:hypothetical protein
MSICGKNACKKCEYKDRCANSDERQQTNEEWFCRLPTDEKAEFYCTVQNCLTIYGDHIATHEDWVKWLKQPHGGES